MKKICVFVDGENFRHSIVDLFVDRFEQKNYLPEADWDKFFDYLTNKVYKESERIRTYWYVIEGIDYVPHLLPSNEGKFKDLLLKFPITGKRVKSLDGEELKTELEKIKKEFEEDKENMRKRCDEWIKIQDGISNRCDAIEFRRAGFIPYFLTTKQFGHEKAVDVKLAIDLITLKDIYDIAVIVSGDQDFVPAVQLIKDLGKRVVNIAFQDEKGNLLPGGAWRLQKVTDKMFSIPYNEFEKFLHL